MPKRGRSDDAGSPSIGSSSPTGSRSLSSSSRTGSLSLGSSSSRSRSVRHHRMPKRGRGDDDAASTSLSYRHPRIPNRGRHDDAASPSKRLRRDSLPDSRGTRDWADLPVDILEMIFVKLTGPALASAQVCYKWRMSAMCFPRPVVLSPARSGRMELLVPTAVMPRGANIAKSEGHRSFSYITLPALKSHPALRLIGGSPSVPLFIDDSHRGLVARRFVGPPEELTNALPESLLSIDLPEGVASRDIYCGIFAPSNSSTSFHLAEEINKIKGVFLATKSSIFGILVKDSRVARIEQPVQIVCDKGVTVAGEQIVVSVLELLCAFLQRAIPRGISFRFNKLIALKIQKDDQRLVVSTGMIWALSTSMLNICDRQVIEKSINCRVQTSSQFT